MKGVVAGEKFIRSVPRQGHGDGPTGELTEEKGRQDGAVTQRLADTRKELFNIRFQSATGAVENLTRLRLARREIARILTVQREQATKAQV